MHILEYYYKDGSLVYVTKLGRGYKIDNIWCKEKYEYDRLVVNDNINVGKEKNGRQHEMRGFGIS